MSGKKRSLYTAAAAAVLLGACALRRSLTVRRYTLHSGKLGSPLRLLLLSDLHSCLYGKAQQKLLQKIRRCRPDVILMAGDMVDDRRSPDGIFQLMPALGRAFPCFYASGNHEFRTRRLAQVKRLLESYGVTVLSGGAHWLQIRGETLCVCGLDDPESFPNDAAWERQLQHCRRAALGEDFSILISHRPERIQQYRDSGFDLVVAGHAHGGQVRIPGLLNGLAAPGQGVFPKYAGGCYPLGQTTLVVSRGLCKNYVPRIFNPPELVCIDLKPARKTEEVL